MNSPTSDYAAHAVATTLANAAHVVDFYWATVEEHDDARRITRTMANLLNALVDGNPPEADKCLRDIDTLLVGFPNGDTSPGAC